MAKAVEVIVIYQTNKMAVQCVADDGSIVNVGNEFGATIRVKPNAHVVAELEAIAERWAFTLGVPLIRHRW